jgi:hypothetical protein
MGHPDIGKNDIELLHLANSEAFATVVGSIGFATDLLEQINQNFTAGLIILDHQHFTLGARLQTLDPEMGVIQIQKYILADQRQAQMCERALAEDTGELQTAPHAFGKMA